MNAKWTLLIAAAILLMAAATGCEGEPTTPPPPKPTSTPMPTPTPSPDDWAAWTATQPEPILSLEAPDLVNGPIPVQVSAPGCNIIVTVDGDIVFQGGEVWIGEVSVLEGEHRVRAEARHETWPSEDSALRQYGGVEKMASQEILVMVDLTRPAFYNLDVFVEQRKMIIEGIACDNQSENIKVGCLGQNTTAKEDGSFRIELGKWDQLAFRSSVVLRATDEAGNFEEISVPVELLPDRAEHYDSHGFLLGVNTSPGFNPYDQGLSQAFGFLDGSYWVVYRHGISRFAGTHWGHWLARIFVLSPVWGGMIALVVWKGQLMVEKSQAKHRLAMSRFALQELALITAKARIPALLAPKPRQRTQQVVPDMQDMLQSAFAAARTTVENQALSRLIRNGNVPMTGPEQFRIGLETAEMPKSERILIQNLFIRAAQMAAVAAEEVKQ